jgi:hypothetical protein
MAALTLWTGCSGLRLSDPQRAEVTALATAVEHAAQADEDARRAALDRAWGATGPRVDHARCPIELPKPVPGDRGIMTDGGVTWQMLTAPVSAVHRKEMAGSESPRFDAIQNALVNDIRVLLTPGYSAGGPAELERALARARRWSHVDEPRVDATLMVGDFVSPQAEGEGFRGGWLRGRFYVYSYADTAVVCAADVTVVSSDRVGVHAVMGSAGRIEAALTDLQRDLYRRAVDEGLRTALAAGPRFAVVE